jgi:hypothetical protein
MEKDVESFIKFTEKKRADIELITTALKKTQFENKTSEVTLPNGSKQQVSKSLDASGKPIFTTSRDDKNTMTSTNPKQLVDYSEE